MRHATVMWLAVGLLAAGASVATPQAKTDSPGVSSERIQELIDRLGSTKYAERDRASKELDKLGPQALQQLRLALQSPDAEVRRRAEMLVRTIEDRQLTASLLAPKRVHLNVKDVSVADAVAELARQSGYPIQLVGNLGNVAGRKITLDTGDTTFWDALRQLSAEAGLVETTAAVNTLPRYGNGGFGNGNGNGKGGFGGGKAKGGKAKGGTFMGDHAGILLPGICLTAGKTADMPTCQAGSVRIRLVQATTLPSGEIEVVLDVAGEPRLEGFGSHGQPRVDRAIDDRGQQLAGVPLPLPTADNNLSNLGGWNGNGGVIVINGNVAINGNTSFGPGQAVGGPNQVRLRLAPGANPAKVLKELSGKLSVQTVVDAGPDIVVDKILQAAGQSTKGKDGKVLHVRGVEQLPNGQVRIQVGMENVVGQGLGGFGNANFNGNVVIIQNGNNIVIANGPGAAPTQAAMPRLLDADGKSFTLVQQSSPSLNINNNQVLQIVTLTYRPQPGQGPAAQLVLPGQRLFTFAVPFTLENVVVR
jgi:hypothetical protein